MGNNLIKYTYDKKLGYQNEVMDHVEWNEKQAYQAWKSNPKKWEGFWDDFWEQRPGDWSVPDYRIYKIDGIPELEHVKRVLAKEGVSDPWLRNEVWRYPPDNHTKGPFILRNLLLGKNFFGVKWGFALAGSVIILENLWWKYKYGGKPVWGHDLRDFWDELNNYTPNQ